MPLIKVRFPEVLNEVMQAFSEPRYHILVATRLRGRLSVWDRIFVSEKKTHDGEQRPVSFVVYWQSFNALLELDEKHLTVTCLSQCGPVFRPSGLKSTSSSLISRDYFCSLGTLEPKVFTVALPSYRVLG